jgi:hypothetical protein
MNVSLEINLVINNSLDLEKDREDFMNWIPFELRLDSNKEIITFSEQVTTAFSVRELKYLIKRLHQIIQIKYNKQAIESPFEYTSSENLFEMILYESGEEDQIYYDFWFNLGSLTNGEIFGFSKGIRFVSHIDYLKSFTIGLERQMIEILNNPTNCRQSESGVTVKTNY